MTMKVTKIRLTNYNRELWKLLLDEISQGIIFPYSLNIRRRTGLFSEKKKKSMQYDFLLQLLKLLFYHLGRAS